MESKQLLTIAFLLLLLAELFNLIAWISWFTRAELFGALPVIAGLIGMVNFVLVGILVICLWYNTSMRIVSPESQQSTVGLKVAALRTKYGERKLYLGGLVIVTVLSLLSFMGCGGTYSGSTGISFLNISVEVALGFQVEAVVTLLNILLCYPPAAWAIHMHLKNTPGTTVNQQPVTVTGVTVQPGPPGNPPPTV